VALQELIISTSASFPIWSGVFVLVRPLLRYSASLASGDNTLLRLAIVSIEENDVKIFKEIVQRYITLLSSEDDFSVNERYASEVDWLAKHLVQRGRADLYEYVLDAFSLAWFSGADIYESLSERSFRLFAALLSRYIKKVRTMG
jgi:hypothetical protein